MSPVESNQPISVALATFNGARFIHEQLRSLTAQRLLPAELVVCDDGSTDSTVEIVRDFAISAPFPVRVEVNVQNLGWRANFLKAASLCRSDLISFCDQDDIWYPDKLAVIEKLFISSDVLAVYHDADLVNEKGEAYARLSDADLPAENLERLQRPSPWSNPPGLVITFRRSLLEFSDLWPQTVDSYQPTKPMAHDQWVFRLATNLGRVRYYPEPLLGYRQHGSNTVGFAISAGSSGDRDKSSPQASYLAMQRSLVVVLGEAAHRSQAFTRELSEALTINMKLLELMETRASLHNAENLTDRLRSYLKLWLRGAYSGKSRWKIGARAALSDLSYSIKR